MKSTTKSGNKDYFKAIAQNRGSKWRKNMLAGRREARLNPSVICLARLRKQLRQEIIAKKLNVSESTFGSIERGKRLVDKDTADQLVKILGVPLEKLFKPNGHKFVAVIPKPVL